MKTQIAVRNLRLCTKDCLCLYVCPTGAADTENSIIDAAKCTGCGVCAAACPGGAISMVPVAYPPQQPKAESVLDPSLAMARRKAEQEKTARQLAAGARDPELRRLMEAVAKSVRLVNEDLLRESGYMLPQSGNAHELLRGLLENPPSPGFPAEAARRLLELLPDNDTPAADGGRAVREYRCKVCGEVFQVEGDAEAVCPLCGATGDKLERIG